ncbi:nitroreductase [Ktedonobacter sp. SOSP1-52]|uniref:nitroreductase family protein n=1 Tax=Ktedonobacter sp. SOSP1-52 TaxID=2778366 RepID=UPI0019150196|nr:nitroreductase family protein [Ktedonobacter sp. SOSP1-52]GHO62594.1 nitroreductase [Ktedonobacter sp. SOSP1-52]
MEFSDAVRKRRMVRHFTSEPVAPETVERLLALAQRAPSAGFTQGQSFIVVTREEMKNAIAELCDEQEYVSSGFHSFISEAPVLVIPCTSEAAYHSRYQESDKVDEDGAEIAWPVPYWHMDIGCSVMLLLLAVVDEGLAAAFAGVPAHNFARFRELLGIPSEVTPVGVIPVGHPAQDRLSPSLKRGRKATTDFIHHEGW